MVFRTSQTSAFQPPPMAAPAPRAQDAPPLAPASSRMPPAHPPLRRKNGIDDLRSLYRRSGTVPGTDMLVQDILRLGGDHGDHAGRGALLRNLRTLALNHRVGLGALGAAQRLAIARACAAAHGAQGPDAAAFAAVRLQFLDEDVVRLANEAGRQRPFSADDPARVRDLQSGQQGAGSAGAASHTRRAAMMNLGGHTWRVKQIAYGPRSAANEVLNTRVMALTGIATPQTDLARQDGQVSSVASRLIPGFTDLGDFLLNAEVVRPLIEQEHGAAGAARYDLLCARFRAASAAVDEMSRGIPPGRGYHYPGKDALRKQNALRLQARKDIFQLLPERLRRETEKAQFLSQLIGDYDFVNFEAFNAGFVLPSLEPAVLDQGNAGIAGFKGGQKVPQNVALADAPAKDSDPYIPNTLRAHEFGFGTELPASRTGAGAIARAVPVAAFLADAIRADTETAERDPGGPRSNRAGRMLREEQRFFAGQLEAAYRLSLIPDEAFRRACAMHWPEPQDASVPYPPSHTLHPSPGEYANTYIARRDALVGKFSAQDIERWRQRHPERARAAYAEVAAAVAHQTGVHLPARFHQAPAPGLHDQSRKYIAEQGRPAGVRPSRSAAA